RPAHHAAPARRRPLGRPAATARDRAGARRPPASAHPRRADRGHPALDHQGHRARDPPARGARRHGDPPRRAVLRLRPRARRPVCGHGARRDPPPGRGGGHGSRRRARAGGDLGMDIASASTALAAAHREDDRAPRADAGAGDAWRAGIELAYERRGERSVPAMRRHYGPLRVQRGLLPEGPGVWHQILVHPPGGVASNDTLDIRVTARAGARALLTSPGAAKWYRARRPGSPLREPGTWATQWLRLRVETGASIEWLPLESIVFDGARARWETRFDVAPGGGLVAAEL